MEKEKEKKENPNTNIRLSEEMLKRVEVVQNRYSQTRTGAIKYLLERGLAYEDSVDALKMDHAHTLIMQTKKRIDEGLHRRAEGE